MVDGLAKNSSPSAPNFSINCLLFMTKNICYLTSSLGLPNLKA